MISLSEVGVSLGARRLFSDVSLRLPAGRRVALVGGNGVGKTTLLDVVLGDREPDTGTVSRPRGTRVGSLPQDVVDAVGASQTVLEHVLQGASLVTDLERRLRRLEDEIASAVDEEQDRLLRTYAAVQDRFETLGGYGVESEAHRVLAGLGFDPGDGARPTRELSGGWRVRVALARLLLSRPDLLVLDEPTNHLDLETIAWLERTLRDLPGGLLFVSHDRDFIDAVSDRIVELAAGTTTEYVVRGGTTAVEQGGFASFVAQREERLTQLRAAKATQDRQLAETERFIERFRYKASKARLVQSRIKALDKVERLEVPDHRTLVARFQFPQPTRSPRVVAELGAATVRYDGRPVLDRVDLVLERERTVAVLGANGAGKTTLLRLLAGDLAPHEGTVRLGPGVEVAVVDQHQAEAMDLSRSVLEEFRTVLDDRHRQLNHRTMLGAFGFPGDLAERRVAELSGGERTRLGLAKAMASPANLLLLDEPTNHLDLASRDVLEDALRAYPGTAVLITHDRHVIRSTADGIIEVGGGDAHWFDGTYEELRWRRERAEPGEANGAGRPPAVGAGVPGATGDRSDGRDVRGEAIPSGRDRQQDKRLEARRRNAMYRATRQLRSTVSRLEDELGRAEAEVARLTRELADPAVYDRPEQARDTVGRHGRAKDLAARLLDRWEEAQLALEEAEAEVEAGLERETEAR